MCVPIVSAFALSSPCSSINRGVAAIWNGLSRDLLEGIKAAVGLTCLQAMSCNERVSKHHNCHMMVESTPGEALELISAQYLLHIAVVLLDRPPEMCPLN